MNFRDSFLDEMEKIGMVVGRRPQLQPGQVRKIRMREDPRTIGRILRAGEPMVGGQVPVSIPGVSSAQVLSQVHPMAGMQLPHVGTGLPAPKSPTPLGYATQLAGRPYGQVT